MINLKSYLTARNGFIAAGVALFIVVFVAGAILERKPVEIRPQSALVPTLQYLTSADLNELKTVALAQASAIADLRASQKSLALELSARIDPLEAALKSMQITTGSISKGKR